MTGAPYGGLSGYCRPTPYSAPRSMKRLSLAVFLLVALSALLFFRRGRDPHLADVSRARGSNSKANSGSGELTSPTPGKAIPKRVEITSEGGPNIGEATSLSLVPIQQASFTNHISESSSTLERNIAERAVEISSGSESFIYEPSIVVSRGFGFRGAEGLVTLYRETRNIYFTLSSGGVKLTRAIRFESQTPRDFQPLDFEIVSPSLLIATGYSVVDGEGMVVGIEFNTTIASITSIETLYKGTAFSRGESICAQPGEVRRFLILDSYGSKVVAFSLIDGEVATLFSSTDWPRMQGVTSLEAGRFRTRSGIGTWYDMRQRKSGPWANSSTSSRHEDPGFADALKYVYLVDMDGDLVPDFD